MSNLCKNNIHLSIPCSSAESAQMICEVLSVDEEFESVQRHISTLDENLIIEFDGADLRKLRISINSILSSILLVLKTVQLFNN